ncbi:MAG TPA: hypothetical protein VMT05_13810 [Terriglobales bacterium]|nr:hypothetical protein [Terriglobales bacterium]
MRLKHRVSAALLAAAIASLPAWSYKEKGSSEGQLVDSGAFGIFRQGRRVGTETFTIHQRPDVNVIVAQLNIDDGADKASQTSDLRVASNGDLRHYEWKELSPAKAQATVDYQDQFLVEHITLTPGSKPVERAFILPPSTVILDDFFAHREVLLWRYLATYCGAAISPQGCKLEPGKFGVFVPREQASTIVAVNYEGKDKVMFHGAERELARFTLQPEDGAAWTLWVEASSPYKLLRILVPAEKVEVLRD